MKTEIFDKFCKTFNTIWYWNCVQYDNIVDNLDKSTSVLFPLQNGVTAKQSMTLAKI